MTKDELINEIHKDIMTYGLRGDVPLLERIKEVIQYAQKHGMAPPEVNDALETGTFKKRYWEEK